MAKVQAPRLDLSPCRRHAVIGMLKQDAEGWWLDGQFLGDRILPSVFAEEIQSGRHLMRSACVAGDRSKRLGEVFGERRHYVVCNMRGEQLGTARSLREAAERLQAHAAGSAPPRDSGTVARPERP